MQGLRTQRLMTKASAVARIHSLASPYLALATDIILASMREHLHNSKRTTLELLLLYHLPRLDTVYRVNLSSILKECTIPRRYHFLTLCNTKGYNQRDHTSPFRSARQFCELTDSMAFIAKLLQDAASANLKLSVGSQGKADCRAAL